MRCPICSQTTRPLFAKHGYDVVACDGCGHRMADVPDWPDHVERFYGDEYFSGGGDGYRDYLSEGSLLRTTGRRYGRIVANYVAPGKMIDIGAAAGFILRGFIDIGWQGVGIEPNQQMAEHARSRLGLDVTTDTIERLAAREEFDLVSMIQVIGHFKDPRAAIGAAGAALCPGGCLLIESWNRSSLTARLFGRHWHEYSPPSVLHWFSPDSLRRLVEKAGFRQLARGRPLKLINGEHAKSLLKYKLGSTPLGRVTARALALMPDSLPIIYPADDLFWAIFRKSDAGNA